MKKKSLWATIVLSLYSIYTSAQVLKIEGGIGISSMKNYSLPIDLDIPDLFKNKIYPFQFSIGTEYLDRGWFNLSSNIGLLRKGGKDEVTVYDETAVPNIEDYICSGTFLTLNTLFDVKKTSHDGYTFYAGAGPSLNIKLGESSELNTENSSSNDFCPINLGLRCELGVKKRFHYTNVGIVAAYQPTLTHLLKEKNEVTDRTFTIGITLDYMFGKRDNNTYHSINRSW